MFRQQQTHLMANVNKAEKRVSSTKNITKESHKNIRHQLPYHCFVLSSWSNGFYCHTNYRQKNRPHEMK